MSYSKCTAPIIADYPSPCTPTTVESDKIMRRLHQINEDLATIRGQLREFEERVVGTNEESKQGPQEPTPTPRPVFLDQVHRTLDDSFNYIAGIRETLTKLQRF